MFLGTYNITDLKVALKTNRFIFHLIFLNLFSFLNSVGQDKDADSRFFLRSWQAHYYKSQWSEIEISTRKMVWLIKDLFVFYNHDL